MTEPAGIDFAQCDHEPVQFANAIQPHGALLVLDALSLQVGQASANSAVYLGWPAAELLGQPLAKVLGAAQAQALADQLSQRPPLRALVHVLTLPSLPGQTRPQALHLFAQRPDAYRLLLEFEPVGAPTHGPADPLLGLRDVMQSLQQQPTLAALLADAVTHLRALSGFERVMAYRFAADGSGEVVAEAVLPGLEPYLGLHYPASDIPAPARRLFGLSPVRHLPDVDYTPVPLLSASAADPIDLSYANLRSVSVMYTGYLRNMGARATLVMPLLKAGKLWGLVSCMQHSQAWYLPYARRVPLELLSQLLSPLLESREELDQQAYRQRLDGVLQRLSTGMGQSDTLHQALMQGACNLLCEIDADGVALFADGRLTLLGKTPPSKAIRVLMDWLSAQAGDVIATHQLGHDCAPLLAQRHLACGVLAIRLSRKSLDWVIWFRPEILHEVHWAGDPAKPVHIDASGTALALQPRQSFARWRQTVAGQSRPWLACELEYAGRLRHAIFGLVADRAWLLAQLNADLERSNLELDAFAYASSHDMKEPLRGIHNFAEFLKMEEGHRLSAKGQQRIDTILRLSGRMADLLDALLQYSRLGKNKLELEACDLDRLVRQTISLVQAAWPNANLSITLHGTLPVTRCDPVWVGKVFQNLLSNALKYNTQASKCIDIGCDPQPQPNPPVFYVRDNGIGIPAQEQKRIFELFHRLHTQDAYGGGSGAGLTLVRRAVERHGGHVWVDSAPGQGSTFYFTLAPPPTEHSTNEVPP